MLFWLGVAVLITYTLIGFEVASGNRKIRFLRDIRPIAPAAAPPVSYNFV